MNAGRLLLSDPIPYESHAPMAGRPACCDPVWKKVTAGSWLIASVCIDLTMQSSSTILAVWGIRSLTHVPDLPCRANSNWEPAMGNDRWNAVMPVRRCPMRTDAGSSSPFIFRSSGL